MNALNYHYSIHPQHVLNIARKDKTYELRTRIPREMKEAIDKGEKVVMWVYCTKGKNRHEELSFQPYGMSHSYLRPHGNGSWLLNNKELNYSKSYAVNGLVVAKCVVDGYEEIKLIEGCFHDEFIYTTYPRLLKQLCLTDNEVTIYGKGKPLYALHLTQVEMLDKPMTVQDFGLTRAPQSYQKVIAPEGFHSCPTT